MIQIKSYRQVTYIDPNDIVRVVARKIVHERRPYSDIVPPPTNYGIDILTKQGDWVFLTFVFHSDMKRVLRQLLKTNVTGKWKL